MLFPLRAEFEKGNISWTDYAGLGVAVGGYRGNFMLFLCLVKCAHSIPMANRPGQDAVRVVLDDSWVELGGANTLTIERDLSRSHRIELFNELTFQSLNHQLEIVLKSLGSPLGCQAVRS